MHLNIEFDASFAKAFDYEFEDSLGRQAKKFRGELSGSGCGFGCRDISFYFKTERSAEKFKAWLGRRKKAWRIHKIDIDDD